VHLCFQQKYIWIHNNKTLKLLAASNEVLLLSAGVSIYDGRFFGQGNSRFYCRLLLLYRRYRSFHNYNPVGSKVYFQLDGRTAAITLTLRHPSDNQLGLLWGFFVRGLLFFRSQYSPLKWRNFRFKWVAGSLAGISSKPGGHFDMAHRSTILAALGLSCCICWLMPNDVGLPGMALA
jgi:hypothetical protein